jgi:hypothetical protein
MAYTPRKELLDVARLAAAKLEADVFFYNGEIGSGRDLEIIELIHENISKPAALLLLTTNGGDPDSAYRMARYFQEHYEKFTVLIGGRCKSAGTLIAVGASELAFTPYGELGPLDIQLTKVDKFDQAQSGLTIQDALSTLEERAKETFYNIVQDYMSANRGMLSFPAASKAAGDFVSNLYAPILGRIDPEEVGARSRSMRIADDYGKRLEAKWQNLRPGTLKKLAETYSSHSFVIDQREAEGLFKEVRVASDWEKALVMALGRYARYQIPVEGGSECLIYALSPRETKQEAANDAEPENDRTTENGRNPEGASGTADAPSIQEQSVGPEQSAQDTAGMESGVDAVAAPPNT